jgi:hypothetical protein
MKKILLKALYALGFVSSINFINAQCSLDQVGAVNYSVTSQFSDLAVAPNGLLYSFAYNSGVGKFYLHSIASPSSSWTPVANISGSTTVKPVVQVSKTGKVYVVLKDDAAGQVGKVFYESAGTFIQVGAPFSGTDKVSDLSIAFNSLGEEYVAYTDVTNGNKSTVKKWDGTSWIPVGTGIVSIGSGYYNSLIIDKTDTPVLAFQDLNAGNKISVYSFDGTSWNLSTSVGSSPSNAKLKLGQNGDYYLGYTEDTNNAIVQKYDGLTWNPLGLPVTNLSPNPNTFDLELDPNDLPYFIALNNTSFYAVAFKYTGVPTWSNVIGGNISSITSVNVNVAVDYKGNPYFSYIDQPSNYGINVKTLSSPISIATQPLSVTRCNGQSGSFSVGTVGGVPTSYQWQTLGAGTFTNSSAPYTNVTTANLAFTANTSMNQNQVRCVVNVGCKNIISNTSTLTVSTLIATTTSTNPTCFNTGDGAISSTISGGVLPYTYTWSPVGGNTPNPTGLYWNTYTLTTADLNGCAITKTVALTSPPSLNTSFSGNMNICSGSNTTLTITASGGTPGYTYSWTPGGSLSTTTGSVVIANPGTTQTYNVSVTDALGCVATDTVMVNVTASPTVTSGANSAICNGSSATLNGGGANTYTWNPGNLVGGTQIVNPTSTTIYTVVGTNTLTGCTNTAITTVTVNALPTANAGPTRTLTCANTSTTLAGSSVGGVAFNWTGPGIVSGGTTLTPTVNLPGVYSLVATSAQGCTSISSNVTITQNTTTPTVSANTTTSSICIGATTTISATGVGANSYIWNPGNLSGATRTVSPSSTTIYTVTGTNTVSGCSATSTVAITVNPLPTITAGPTKTLTCASSFTVVTCSSVGGTSYNWNGPGIISGYTTTNCNVGSPGTYTVFAISPFGCNSTNATVLVVSNTTPPSVSASATGTLSCSTSTVALNGGPASGVTYQWSGPGFSGGTTSQNAIANAVGSFTLKVTSSINSCTNSATTVVSQNITPPSASASNSSTLTCVTTTASLIGSGGGTYMWSGPGILSGSTTTSPIVNLPGCYNLTVTAANGCTATASSCITQNTTTPSANAGLDQSLTCASTTVTLNGSAVPSSCTPVWTGGVASGSNSFNATASSAGDYTLTVTNPANGCLATDIVQVTANASIPTITISLSNTLTCANTTATTSASSSAALPTYLWSGPSVVSGGTTANAIVDQPGNYTVTVTDIPTGCSATSNINVTQDITLPSVTFTSSSSVICSGNSSTLTANGALTYTWSTTQNTSSISVSPGTTSSFTVSGTGTNGCVNSAIETITVNATPTLAITGNTNICNGSTSTLTGSGATSYTWDSGVNTTTISVTPTITTTYTLNGDNGNGCSSLLPVTVSIIPNKAISGVVTSTNGATSGDIIIYKYTGALSQWDQLTLTPISGTYSFNNVDSGLYVIRAIPTATNIQVTYAPNSISWQGATIINHGCTNNTTQNIDLIGFAPFVVGPGVVTGNIVEAAGFGARMSNESKPTVPGTPIGGIIVKGGKNPGGQMYVQTLTDASGNYTLTGFPINTLPDDYFVFVDIPGLDTNSTYYHISFAVNDTVVNGLDFNVDAQYINPIGSVTGISNDQSVLESKITLFPNPASQKFTLEYELTQSANVLIELFDIVGHKVKTISSNSFEEKDKHSHSTNIEDLSTGVYFVKVKINNSETTIKLIIN